MVDHQAVRAEGHDSSRAWCLQFLATAAEVCEEHGGMWPSAPAGGGAGADALPHPIWGRPRPAVSAYMRLLQFLGEAEVGGVA